jgi:hypothetical protein
MASPPSSAEAGNEEAIMVGKVGASGNLNMRRLRLRWLTQAAAAGLALASAPALAVNGHDETNGDLSNVNTSPTPVTVGLGDNLFLGTTGKTGDVIDRDYFTFTIAAGQQLTAIMVLPGTTSIAGANLDNPLSFIGLEAGSTVTNPAAPVVGDLLGYTHYGPGLIGSDILDNIGAGAGAQGFTGPLGAGTYSVWIQEANVGTAHYAFDFILGAVPEPSSWAMMLSGFGLIGWSLRRRAQKGNGPSSERSAAM